MKGEDYLHRSYLTIAGAIFFLSKIFKNIAIPIRTTFNYDIIGERSNKIHRIKVIYTNCKQKSGKYIANLRKSGGYSEKKENKFPFDSSVCEYVYVETPEARYLIPTSNISNCRSITLSQFEEFRLNSLRGNTQAANEDRL